MKAVNPRLIGLFVIGGLALLVLAIVFFSRQDLFAHKRRFVAYFQQSVNGLNVGAPVRFRGIPIGKVIRIDGVYEPKSGIMMPRLILEVSPEKMVNAVLREGEYNLFPLFVKNGMRATLKSTSLLTGRLYVALDFHPGTPVRQLGTGHERYPEMPTIDSSLDQTLQRLSGLPLDEVVAHLTSTLIAAEAVLRDPGLARALERLPRVLADIDAAFVDLRRYVNHGLRPATDDVRATLARARGSLDSLTQTLDRVPLDGLRTGLAELEQTLRRLQDRLSPDDPVNHELLRMLREVVATARSMREVFDLIEEHPEALIRGKEGE